MWFICIFNFSTSRTRKLKFDEVGMESLPMALSRIRRPVRFLQFLSWMAWLRISARIFSTETGHLSLSPILFLCLNFSEKRLSMRIQTCTLLKVYTDRHSRIVKKHSIIGVNHSIIVIWLVATLRIFCRVFITKLEYNIIKNKYMKFYKFFLRSRLHSLKIVAW